MSYYSQDENERPVQGTEVKKDLVLNGFELHQKRQEEKSRIEALKFRERGHADIDLQEHLQAEHNKYNSY